MILGYVFFFSIQTVSHPCLTTLLSTFNWYEQNKFKFIKSQQLKILVLVATKNWSSSEKTPWPAMAMTAVATGAFGKIAGTFGQWPLRRGLGGGIFPTKTASSFFDALEEPSSRISWISWITLEISCFFSLQVVVVFFGPKRPMRRRFRAAGESWSKRPAGRQWCNGIPGTSSPFYIYIYMGVRCTFLVPPPPPWYGPPPSPQYWQQQ